MADNLRYGLYNKDDVSPGYFGETESNIDDELASFGVTQDAEETIIPKSELFVDDSSDFSIVDSTKEFVTGVGSGLKEVGEEVLEGFGTLGEDIRKIETGRLEETTGLLGDFVNAGQDNLDRITAFNKAVDDTGGNMFAKVIGAGLSTVGTGVDFTGDVVSSGLKTLAPEGLESATVDSVKAFAETDFGQGLIGLVKSGSDKYKEFKASSPEANRAGLALELLLPIAELGTGFVGTKIAKEGAEAGLKSLGEAAQSGKEIIEGRVESIKEGISDIKLPELPKIQKDDNLLKKLELETEKGLINGIEVDIPKVDKGIVETISGPVREKNTKVLAGRALSPRTVGKSAKQKLTSIQDVEKNAKTFYENVRTGVIDGDISTIENASQTVVDNIDTIGARIGEAVKKVDGRIDIDNNLTDNLIEALNTKGSTVSPATPILRKFIDDLGDGNLSIADAFEIKKAYGNEVSKLYKSGDAGTQQFKVLSDGVKSINQQIDNIIDTELGSEFASDKAVFRNLKLIVDDIVASTLVEGRRSPNTLAEQIGFIEGLLSPVESVKQSFIKEIGDLNTRGGAWKELIKIYDTNAINNIKK